MRRFGFGVFVRATLLISIPASPAALCAQAAPPSTVQQLVATPAYQANVARLFAQLPPDVFQRCPSLVSKGSTVTVIEPATFATDGFPTAGLWLQRFPVSGCGNDTTINLFFKAGPDGKIQSVVAAPGETNAGLQLQRDAARYVMLAVQAKAPGCSARHIRSTRYVGAGDDGAPAPRSPGQPWHEVWTVAACGQRYDVPLTFAPDATGTTIGAAPAQLVAP